MQAGAYRALEDRRLLGALWPNGGVQGMAPSVEVGTMNIQLGQGVAAVPDVRAVGGAYLCASDAPESVTLPQAPPALTDRIDLVIVRPRDSAFGGSDNDWIFDVEAGAPGANPIVPAVPLGTIPIAQQRVVGGSAFIAAANLVDRRGVLLSPSNEPPTTSAALVSRVDAMGERWVARAGANGGAWRRARDVLVARWYRQAALPLATGLTALALDTAANDDYGLYVPASVGFIAPITGFYDVLAHFSANSTAVGQSWRIVPYLNGVINVNIYSPSSQATGQTLGVDVSMIVRMNAGEVFALNGVATAALNLNPSAAFNFASFAYRGG
jgi:hypothetical protein